MGDLDLDAVKARLESVRDAPAGSVRSSAARLASSMDVPALIAEVERLRAQIDEVQALHTDSVIGPCPCCYRPADVSDADDGLVWWPCPTLLALGVKPVTVELFRPLGGSGG